MVFWKVVFQLAFLTLAQSVLYAGEIPQSPSLPALFFGYGFFAISSVLFYVVNIVLLMTPQTTAPLKGPYRQSLEYGCVPCSLCSASGLGSTLTKRRMKCLFFVSGGSYILWCVLVFSSFGNDINAAFIVGLLNIMLMIVVWYHLSKVFFDSFKPHALFFISAVVVVLNAIYTTHLFHPKTGT